jgi:hypothetical protein
LYSNTERLGFLCFQQRTTYRLPTQL